MISEKVPRKIQEATFITRRPLTCIARAVMPFLLLLFFCLLMVSPTFRSSPPCCPRCFG